METRLDRSGIEVINARIGTETALEAIRWARVAFGDRCAVLTSMQEAVVIELAMRVDREIPVVFLDNGYHFDETLDTVRAVERRYGIDVEMVGPFDEPRPAVEPGECCDVKPALLEAALADRDAWISGIRRDQTAIRREASLVERDRRGLIKVNPLVQWSNAEHRRFVAEFDVVRNPLLDRGYTSIGCRSCTAPPIDADSRSGRWAGSERTECGLHL